MRAALIGFLLAAMLAAIGSASPAHALTRQQVVLEFDPTPDDRFNNDETRDGVSIDDRNGPIDRSITARIDDPIGRFVSQGSVGAFGNLGIFGNSGLVGTLDTQIFIESDDFQNRTGRAQRAQAQFIIDGGEFFMIAGVGSVIDFNLTVRKNFDVVYQSFFEYRSSFDPIAGLQNSLTTIGDDLGIQANNPFGIEIPVNFVTADLGIIQSNEVFELAYQLDITATMVDFVEGMSFEFSDPFSVDGFGDFPTVSFSDPVQAVPLPATAPLAAAAFGLLLIVRRRRRAR